MFDFLWHLRGSVALRPTDTDQLVFDRLEMLLDRQRKNTRMRTAELLTFEYPLFGDLFAPNWLAMIIYDAGRFWIDGNERERVLRYDLRSLHGLVFCSVAAALAFFFGLISGGFLTAISLAAAAFTWLYGMNMLLAFARVPAAIRKAVISA
ncbi:hypothetical protein [Croceibacterium aestuarii]|uniref:hypothetical protein n=1 Tax=Croceibacterium aestuarii TaxID=3064139 RepID=UPI00272EA3D3|nr:hypothetical protein [Croceibacterium sp. D39]